MGEIDNPKIGNAKNWKYQKLEIGGKIDSPKNWKFILKIDNPKIGEKLENWGEN